MLQRCPMEQFHSVDGTHMCLRCSLVKPVTPDCYRQVAALLCCNMIITLCSFRQGRMEAGDTWLYCKMFRMINT